MEKRSIVSLRLALLCLFLTSTIAVRQSYVVYLGQHFHESLDAIDHDLVKSSHYEFLGKSLGSVDKAKDVIFYSYTKHINGFAALLEEEEAAEIAKRPDVISVVRDSIYSLHTTRSWEFMGIEYGGKTLPGSVWEKANYGEDVIIANIDTGIWPESESFNDDGLGPIPARWKGVCQNSTDKDGVKCNKKLIGARYFNKGWLTGVNEGAAAPVTMDDLGFNSPRDSEGHGSHTLSTAGGSFVANASIFGNGAGTAKGGSPKARVAAYKVCWPEVPLKNISGGCSASDILAAFDAAIADGVDVISGSLGGSQAYYFNDLTAIGAFHAIMKGITVVMSAGNSGPFPMTVTNLAPWIFTVAASTQDRHFLSAVSLGKDGDVTLKGASLSADSLPKKLFPLASANDLAISNATAAGLCVIDTLDPAKTKGKIVACLRGENARVDKGYAVKKAGGVGMILCNAEVHGNEILSDAHVLPATHLTASDGQKVFDYIRSTKSPVGYIAPPVTTLGVKPSPVMASFSSQGPNIINPEILKPDITAPGVDILAAITEATSPTELPYDRRRLKFALMSGTSMSCPHVAGIIALVKKVHRDWSPAAIRSAIMTTARRRDNSKVPIRDGSLVKATPFNYGAGHVRPNRAVDPGLVYDSDVEDYLKFLCANGYDSKTISYLTAGKPYHCPTKVPKIGDLNYPSIVFDLSIQSEDTLSRTVKNVGTPGTYKVRVQPPAGISITVKPDTLKFEKVGEEKSFTVTAKLEIEGDGYTFGRLIWSDGKHFVRSSIAVNAVTTA